jgi:hypothetical protein
MAEFILNNIEQFTEFIPTAEGSDLNVLKSFLKESEYSLKDELLGNDLYEVIKELDETSMVLKYARAAICLKAYLTAIPFLDLIQTPNGFAVVNNANHAPASRERVDKLLLFVERRLSTETDALIITFLKEDDLWEEWKKAEFIFNKHTEIVYLTAKELREYSNNNTFIGKDLLSIHPTVLMLQSHIAGYISIDYMAELIDKRRNSNLSEFDVKVFEDLKTIIGLKLQKLEAYHLIENLLNYMIAHPSEFPTYINSVEYKLKISQKYENKKRDTTFFFGV